MKNKIFFYTTLVFIAYLVVFLISVYFYYETDGRFKSTAWFSAFYTYWGVWIYSLYFTPFIILPFILVRQLLRREYLKFSYYMTALLFLVGIHLAYSQAVAIYKKHVYDMQQANPKITEKQLNTVGITEPVMAYKPATDSQKAIFTINTTISNPLSYDVNLYLNAYHKEKVYDLVKARIKANEIKSLSIEVDEHIVLETSQYSYGFWINSSLTEDVSSPRITQSVKLSHELCKWSMLLTCPDFDQDLSSLQGYGCYPFFDDMLPYGAGTYRRGATLVKYRKDQIEVLMNQ